MTTEEKLAEALALIKRQRQYIRTLYTSRNKRKPKKGKAMKRLNDDPAVRLAECRGEAVPPAGGEPAMTFGDKRNPFRNPAIADGYASGWNHRNSEVTRLTAENARLQAEAMRLHGRVREEQAYVSELAEEHTAMQAELTKAREFLVHVKKCLARNKEYAPLSHEELDGLIGHSPSASCRNECGCLWCHQSAPAAKGGE